MTTTPAPTEIDAIRKHIQLAEDWADYGHVGDPNWHVARTLIKQVPALLDELATARRDVEGLTRTAADLIKQVSNAGEAMAAWTERTKDARGQRDAAHEELAKTRAELAKAQQMGAMAGRHAQQRDADLKDAEVTIQRLKTRLAEGDARWSRHMADEHPIEAEANPATTAEPADEPKATNQTCGYAFVGNVGEFTCDLYDPHPGKHWNSLAEFAWTAEPSPERAP